MQVYQARNGMWVILMNALTGQHFDGMFSTKEQADAKVIDLKAAA